MKSTTESDTVVHLTSADSEEVAAIIEEASRKIFEKNREAYRILAKYDSADLISSEDSALERAATEKFTRNFNEGDKNVSL